jgi:hypothetical protein
MEAGGEMSVLCLGQNHLTCTENRGVSATQIIKIAVITASFQKRKKPGVCARLFCGLDGTRTFDFGYATLFHKLLKIKFLKN